MYGPALTGSWSKIKKYQNENWFKRLIFKNTYNNSALEASIDEIHSKLTYKFDIII